jgi:hypothetical protein
MHAPRRVLVLFALLACHHQEDGGSTPATQPPPGGSSPGNAVTGSKVDLYLGERGEVKVPVGPDRLKVAALILQSGGGFTTVEGTVKTDGSFTIPNVPAGTYYLRVDHKYLWSEDWYPSFYVTEERSIDLSDIDQGRPDVAVATPGRPTNLVIDATGLSPYQSGDFLQIYSQGADIMESDVFWAATNLNAGDTRLFGLTIDVSKLGFANLIDGSKGDTAIFSHLTRRVPEMDEPINYRAVADVLTPSPFTVRDGQTVNITGAFKDVPQRDLTVTWNLTEFAALAEEASAGSKVDDHRVYLFADPGGADRLLSGSFSADLLTGSVGGGDERDQSFHLSYGNTFPASWPVTASFSTSFLPSWDNGEVVATVGVVMPLASATEGAIVPVISPPRALQINGQPAQGALAGIGETPTIAWEPPTRGTPRVYFVSVNQKKAGSDYWDEVINFYTEGRSVTVPPGYIQAGTSTYVSVRARTNHDQRLPNRRSALNAFASTVSGPLMP